MKKVTLLFFFFTIVIWNSLNAQNKLSPGDSIFWKVIDFDSTYSCIRIDTSAQNVWQIGQPYKIIFNSAYSTQQAIVTDTVNYYPPKNHSYFDLYVGTSNCAWYPYDIFIDFWHKFDTDTLKDGGYITVSWDNGLTWTNIIKDTFYPDSIGGIPPGFGVFTNNLYTESNKLFNGEFGYSGQSNGWLNTCFSWVVLPMKFNLPPDTMIIRFNFVSDSIDNPKEGWIIDHLRIFSLEFAGGINELDGNSYSLLAFPNPFSSTTQITLSQTYHNILLSVFDIQGKLVAQNQYQETNNIILNKNKLNNGMYFLKFVLDEKEVATGKVVVSD